MRGAKLREKKIKRGHPNVQRVQENGTTSEPRSIMVGTFQGISLGPMLFNIMANDLTAYIPATINDFQVNNTRYADDSQIVLTGPRSRLADIQTSMSSLLDDTLTWLLQHGMQVNTKKTELLLIAGPRLLPNPLDQSR